MSDSNVTYRIQNFHNIGYQSALKDCDNFLKAAIEKFGDRQFNHVTLGEFLGLVAKEMNECFGGTLYNSNVMEKINDR